MEKKASATAHLTDKEKKALLSKLLWERVESQKLPLSFEQERLWILEQLEEVGAAYHISQAYRLRGELNVEALEKSINEVIARHDVLHTRIVTDNGVPHQQIMRPAFLALPIIDLQGNPPEEQEEALYRLAAQESCRPFTVDQGPCLRVCLFKINQAECVLLVTVHHIFFDGWSAKIFWQELATLYEAYTKGETTSPIPPLPIQYVDYAQWQRKQLQDDALPAQLDYWRKQMEDAAPVLALPTDHPRPAVQTFQGAAHTFTLSEELTEPLKRLGQQEQTTLFMTLLAAFKVLLYRYTSQSDIVVGTPVAGRNQVELEGLIGFFVNNLVLRTGLSDNLSFRELLQRIRETALGAYSHQDVPFARLVQELQPERDLSHNPLFQVLFSLENEPVRVPRLAGLDVEPVTIERGTVQFDLSLMLEVGEGGWKGAFRYNTGLFESATVVRMASHLEQLLKGIVENPDQSIGLLPLLTEAERHQMLVEWNDTERDYPQDKCIHELFEEQVERTPEATAVIFEEEEITYQELNKRANQLAHYLRKLGVGPEVLVGICMEHSIEMVIGLLGILKAGGAYVPLDPSYPQERLAFMLADTKAVVLITQEHLQDKLPMKHETKLVFLEAEWDKLASENETNPKNATISQNLVYVIYTSGSTGKPKGVMIEHKGLIDYICWAERQYLRGKSHCFPLFSSLAFDLTGTSIYLPLVFGGTVMVYQNDIQELSVLDVFQEDKVDIVKLTPAHLSLIWEIDLAKSGIGKLIVGGEDFKVNLAQAVSDRFENEIEIYNEYGPTEAVVGCMIHPFDSMRDTGTSVPIGTPADNTQIYVMDACLNLVPIGITGEIYINGDGVARGYLNRPGLTAERFIPSPFEPVGRLYKTGDLARWNQAGKLEFLGRADQQVKIRGTRIELGEIEETLLAHPDIRNCVVEIIQQQRNESFSYCTKCGLPSNYPSVTFNNGVCSLCVEFEEHKDEIKLYFRAADELSSLLEKIKSKPSGEYDCLVLLSGGKDSTYMLYQLAQMDLNILAFTLDNGYISEGAKANIRRVVQELAIDHVFGSTPAMKEIFVDSLKRYSHVCNGCFKTIYTLAMKLAHQKGIRYIVTGLSRGQFFETRLTADMFIKPFFNSERKIDDVILEARKAYHRRDDAVSRLLDTDIFKEEAIFDSIQFIDFYRYCDVELDEVYAFLDKHAPWIRPNDTGRSTNCLINDVGIYIHKKERGYHNYALPYSWDVRLGHKSRDDALAELNDDIDEKWVQSVMHEIGYSINDEQSVQTEVNLVAYYVPKRSLSTSELKDHLSQTLPDYMIPPYFVELEEFPLTPNGKIDRSELPEPSIGRSKLKTEYDAPRTLTEQKITQIWEDILCLKQIGINDNFFDLSGHSLLIMQVKSRVDDVFEVDIPVRVFFEFPTIANLSTIIVQERVRLEDEEIVRLMLNELENLSDDEVQTILTSVNNEL